MPVCMFIDGFNLHDAGSAINRPVIMAGSATHQRFSSKPLSTLGFFLKCGALQSPNSQRANSVFDAFSALVATALFHFLASTSPDVVPTHGSTCPAREHRMHVGLRASRLLFLWSQKKLSGKDFDDQERYPNRGRQIPSFAICQSAGRGPLCGFSLHSLWPRQRHPRQGASF